MRAHARIESEPRPMTVEEFEAWADTQPGDELYELVDGEPRMMSGPSAPHAAVQGKLIAGIDSRLRSGCFALGPVGFRLDRHNERVPDITIYRGAIAPGRIDAASVVVEIVSDRNTARELVDKMIRYMRAPTLQEIWIVASHARHLQRWSRDETERWCGEALGGEDALVSPLLTSALPLGSLFESVGL